MFTHHRLDLLVQRIRCPIFGLTRRFMFRFHYRASLRVVALPVTSPGPKAALPRAKAHKYCHKPIISHTVSLEIIPYT